MPKKTRAERRREKVQKTDKPPLTERIPPFLSFKHPITRFCLLFLGLLVAFAILLSQKPIEQLFSTPITTFIASQATWILKALGMDVYARGVSISGEGFSVEILGNCNAIFETMLFLSAIIAFPSSLKEKAIGGIVGTIFIYLLNLARVVILFLIGVYAPQYFDESHVYISQTIFIVMVAIFWLLWIGKGVKNIPPNNILYFFIKISPLLPCNHAPVVFHPPVFETLLWFFTIKASQWVGHIPFHTPEISENGKFYCRVVDGGMSFTLKTITLNLLIAVPLLLLYLSDFFKEVENDRCGLLFLFLFQSLYPARFLLYSEVYRIYPAFMQKEIRIDHIVSLQSHSI